MAEIRIEHGSITIKDSDTTVDELAEVAIKLWNFTRSPSGPLEPKPQSVESSSDVIPFPTNTG